MNGSSIENAYSNSSVVSDGIWTPEGPGRFTLIEMLVVLVIIGLIMGLVGPRVLSYLTDRAHERRRGFRS